MFALAPRMVVRLRHQHQERLRFRGPRGRRECARVALQEFSVAFIVNSSPGAGFRFEPSATFDNAKAALGWAVGLERRGMRLIRIKDTVSGLIYDERDLRAEIKRVAQEAS